MVNMANPTQTDALLNAVPPIPASPSLLTAAIEAAGPGASGEHAIAFLSPRTERLRRAYVRATVGDLDGVALADRLELQAIAIETALLLFGDLYGTDGPLRAALTAKWVHFQPHFEECIADVVHMDRDRLTRQLDAVLVLLHTFASDDDLALRQALLAKLGCMGRAGDVPAILRQILNGTPEDVATGVAALRVLLARLSPTDDVARPRRQPRRRPSRRSDANSQEIANALAAHLNDDTRATLLARLDANAR